MPYQQNLWFQLMCVYCQVVCSSVSRNKNLSVLILSLTLLGIEFIVNTAWYKKKGALTSGGLVCWDIKHILISSVSGVKLAICH